MTDKIQMKTSWESINFNEFEQLIQIAEANIPEHYKTSHLISILTGLSIEEIEDLPITVYTKLASHLTFMNETPKEIKHQMEYEVNGRVYEVHAEVDKICTAQFLDYTTYMREEQPSLRKLTSCFIIPKGHKYGDGYDMNQVLFDIGCMQFQDVKALSFFLQLQYAAYMQISIDSMDRQMKKMKIPKKKRKETLTHLNNMVRSLLS